MLKMFSLTIKLLLLLLLLFLLPLKACKTSQVTKLKYNYVHKYYTPGDHIIGGTFPHNFYVDETENFDTYPKQIYILNKRLMRKNHFQALTFLFTRKEIDENLNLLPNISFGFHMLENYFVPQLTFRRTMNLFATDHQRILNYKCGRKDSLLAIVGGMNSEASIAMANILGLYKIPQLSYGSFAPELSDKIQYPFFYRMSSNQDLYLSAIIHLLLHFKWTWVGLFVHEGNNEDMFLQKIASAFTQNGICSSFVVRLPHLNSSVKHLRFIHEQKETVQHSTVKAVILYADSYTLLHFWSNTSGRVFISAVQFDFLADEYVSSVDSSVYFNGAFSLASHSTEMRAFRDFLLNLDPHSSDGGCITQAFWQIMFSCWMPMCFLPATMHLSQCTGKEKLQDWNPSGFLLGTSSESYSIYITVYAVVHALHNMYSAISSHKPRGERRKEHLWSLEPWELHPYLGNVQFNNSVGDAVYFNKNGELAVGYDILNWFIYPNETLGKLKVGRMEPRGSLIQDFHINESVINWHPSFNQITPCSRCTEICYPGYVKVVKEEEPVCCFDCSPCPEGTISNTTDTNNCRRCPDDKYPNKSRNECIPKVINFLSYEEPLGQFFSSSALLFFFTTLGVLGIFIRHNDTPIVKANNRELTHFLLLSLMLCFLCSLLFIGRPGKVTCLLQHTVLGIVFTVAIACVLAKTITVVLAFMVVYPASKTRRWTSKRLSIFIVLSCFLTQLSITVVWLATSPPFPELDMHSQPKEIIMQCNEGSITMFYVVLAYMGLLATATLAVAFFARKLPGSFNEAKCITFSMTIFCSVWISYVPAYLSSKGRYMSAVVIFSILSSTLGLLAFIFLSKCYIIVLKPGLNTKEQLVIRKTMIRKERE